MNLAGCGFQLSDATLGVMAENKRDKRLGSLKVYSAGKPPSQPIRSDGLRDVQGPLFGGVAGIKLSKPSLTIVPGFELRATYAKIFAPYMMAFRRPGPGAEYGEPWRAARGGISIEISIEAFLEDRVRPTGLNRLNTLWWLLALIRLRTGANARMPVISNMEFRDVVLSKVEPSLLTIEMSPHQIQTVQNPPSEISSEDLDWICQNFVSGSTLLEAQNFYRSILTFDNAVWAQNSGSAILMIWAAMECLFRPGRQGITKALSSLLASYLHPPGSGRDREFRNVYDLYNARGAAVHDAKHPEIDELRNSFLIARRVLIQCIERRELPNNQVLRRKWEEKA